HAAAEAPGHRFRAEFAGTEVGFLGWTPDLAFGGSLPALAGWAQLTSLGVREGWRGKGVGPWLVSSTVPFLRMVGVRRVVVALTAREEASGAGRMCPRPRWRPPGPPGPGRAEGAPDGAGGAPPGPARPAGRPR